MKQFVTILVLAASFASSGCAASPARPGDAGGLRGPYVSGNVGYGAH